MFFIQRALKYLKMKLGKTFLLGIIFLVIANFVLAGLLVQNASQKAQDNTRIAVGTDIVYVPNYDAYIEAINNGVLSRKEMGKLKSSTGIIISDAIHNGGGPTYGNFMSVVDSEYVEKYHFQLNAEVLGKDLEAVQVVDGVVTNNHFGVEFYGALLPQPFDDKSVKLTEGRLPTEEEINTGTPVVVVEQRVMSENALSIGDQMLLTYNIVDNEAVELSHKIVGVYKTTETLDKFAISNGNTAAYPMNRIYTPFRVLETIGLSSEELNFIMLADNVIQLEDPSNLEVFRASVESKIDFDFGMLDANDALYKSLVGPIESIGLISNVLVASIVITGAFIIGLITALTINDRKGEIGILLAVGESKVKIVSQFVLEVVLIAVVAFSISLFTGEMIGEQVSGSILDSEILGTVESMEMIKGRDVINKEGKELFGEVAKIELSLDVTIIAKLFAMGLILTIVSTAIPSLYVMRFNPKQILTNRNS